jgi:multidrug efflux pump subunit AcrA (membrane-fusion protein)
VPRREAKRSRRTDRRIWIVAAVVAFLLLGGAGIVVWRLTSSSTAGTTTERTVEVTQQTIKQTVGSTGTLQPKRRADLSFSTSGTINSVRVSVGEHVVKGQRLAAIDTAALKADLDAAKADYQAAKDDLATAQDDSSTTDTQLNAAKSKVAVQKSNLAQAKSTLASATLRAPFTGAIALVNVSVGDTVGSSSGSGQGSSGSSGSGSAAITVISTGSYTVQASVDSADVGKIKKGMTADITVTGSNAVHRGTVSSVAVMATSSSGSGAGSTSNGNGAGSNSGSAGSPTFAVSINLTGSQQNLYAGASATVSIVVQQRSNVLTVPTIAIRTVDGKTVVTKLVSGQGVQTEIGVGESFGGLTEVTRGLVAGDQVVISVPSRANAASASPSGQRRFGQGGFPGGGFGQRQGNPDGQSGGAGRGGGAGQGAGAGQTGSTR